MFDRCGWLTPARAASAVIDSPERCRMTRSACRLIAMDR